MDKELANVRMAFSSGKMSPCVSPSPFPSPPFFPLHPAPSPPSYDRKKYVWKLVFINMMGYDVDFGHMEMIALLSSPTYAEKLVGYMAVSVMMTSADPSITLVIQAIKTDLASTQDPIQCLALCATANIGGKALAEEIKEDVQRILFSRSIFPIVRKKAALCLLRLVRVNRDLQLGTEEWKNKLTPLLEDKNLGVVLSVVSLILGLADAAGKDAALYDGCTGHLLVLLTRLAVRKEAPEDYLYHSVACPWLQVKILRLLQHFPVPALERQRSALNELLSHILTKTEVTKSVNRNNAEHCVLFEAVALIIRQGELSLPELRAKAVAHLSKFINIKEPNIRYLGLDTMARMLDQEGCGDAIRKQQATIMLSMKDADISVRRRALSLLFALCNSELAVELVKELLAVLAMSYWQFRDELVLKIAILAERYSPQLAWYVDTVVQLIALAGDNVSDDIWHRLVQVVTNHEELQQYAAARLYAAVEPATAHETAVKVGAYVLGEFGYKLTEGGGPEGGAPVGGAQQFAALHQHFAKCSTATKCILLSCYAKLQNLYPEICPIVVPIFEAHTTSIDAELQQRALEYLHLPQLAEATLSAVLDAMPAFPERDSHLETKLRKLEVRAQSSFSRCFFFLASPPYLLLPPNLPNTLTQVQEEKQDKDAWEGKNGGSSSGAAGSGGGGGAAEEADAAPPPAVARAPAAAPSSSDDLLGLGGFGSAPAAASPVDALSVPVTTRIGVEPGARERVAALLAVASARSSGVLFEDASVQVGVKKAISGAEGTVTLFLGNKVGVPLVGLKVRVPEHSGVAVAVGELPAAIAPKSQAQVTLRVESKAPFTEPPVLQLSFISTPGTGHAYLLSVPVALANFCTAVPMPPPDFKAKWGALAGAPREVTAVVAPGSGGGAVTLAAAAGALAALNMGAVDATPTAATGAATFRTKTLAPTGQPVSVGALAMVIPDAAGGAFKCAVRTQHESVSKALLAQLQAGLAAL